jgi:hypothetical protein
VTLAISCSGGSGPATRAAWGVAHLTGGELRRSDFQCLLIDANVNLAPDAPLEPPYVRAEKLIRHRRHTKAVSEMLLALQFVDANPFEVRTVTGKLEKRMRMAERTAPAR